MRESVRLADDEAVEGVAGIQGGPRGRLCSSDPWGTYFQLREQRRWARAREPAVCLAVGLRTGTEFDPDRSADQVGSDGVDRRAQFAFEPGDMERIGDGYTDDACARVIRQPTCTS